ncbi:hypothetical protein KPSA1_05826 [Pseudomonas syringae pv. actinidiae]|uniref:Uncharacterized protein n=1 Tax=Pseudomonas syringae pv. actinidiae TaxID=103796 RepID=A0A2V0QHE2_PSESF|nr:hypothetical protein KPSA1_05826 [Pseudomonas syringae pv. actinidiae]GBH15785.1 hypothetical protein KPSA3_01717 [Pseudomonas syringae pv. actinidiae]
MQSALGIATRQLKETREKGLSGVLHIIVPVTIILAALTALLGLAALWLFGAWRTRR